MTLKLCVGVAVIKLDMQTGIGHGLRCDPFVENQNHVA